MQTCKRANCFWLPPPPAGMAVGTDRLRRGAARQSAEEARAAVALQWRDLHRSLTSERGLWAEEEPADGGLAPFALLDGYRSRLRTANVNFL